MNATFRRVYTLLVLISFLYNTLPGQYGKIVHIDAEKAINNKVNLKASDLVNSVEYVKLETTNESIFKSGEVTLTDDFIFITDPNQPTILKFDRNGKFISSIGRFGRGPGEYLDRIRRIDVSPDQSKLIIYCSRSDKLLQYTVDGEFIGSLELPFNLNHEPVFITDQMVILTPAIRKLKTKDYPLICSFNLKTSKIDTLKTADIDNTASMSSFTLLNKLYRINDKVFFKDGISDTIFSINQNMTIIPEFKIDIGPIKNTYYSMSLDEAKLAKSVSICFETPTHLLVKVSIPEGYYIIYDKVSGLTGTNKRHMECDSWEWSSGSWLPNDIDGYQPFWPWYWDHGYKDLSAHLVGVLNLMEFFDSKDRDHYELKNPESQKRLKKIVDNSNYDDNPIVRIWHYKTY